MACAQFCLLPSFAPTPNCPHLAPFCLPFDTSARKHAGSLLPLHTEGEFYLTGRKIHPVHAPRMYQKMSGRDQKSDNTYSISCYGWLHIRLLILCSVLNTCCMFGSPLLITGECHKNMIGSTLCRMIFKWNSYEIYLTVMLIFIQSVMLLQYPVIMEGEYETCYITEYNTEVSSVLCDDFKHKSHKSTQTVRTVYIVFCDCGAKTTPDDIINSLDFAKTNFNSKILVL